MIYIVCADIVIVVLTMWDLTLSCVLQKSNDVRLIYRVQEYISVT